MELVELTAVSDDQEVPFVKFHLLHDAFGCVKDIHLT